MVLEIVKWMGWLKRRLLQLQGSLKAIARRIAQLATSFGLLNFILKGDSLMVTQALQLPTITQDCRIASTLSIIHSIIPHFSSWIARKINRSANLCAHHVANWAATRLFSGYIIVIPTLSSSPLYWNRLPILLLCSLAL
jgi:hypothetical protein